jgi:hypothetical protein
MKLPRWQQQKEEELEAEIQSHLDMAARERMERGETAEQARAAVRREFGNAYGCDARDTKDSGRATDCNVIARPIA